MYKIVALIDFTPTTEVVVDFTKKIALQKKAEVVLLTIVPKSGAEAVAEGKQKLQVYLDLLKGAGVVASAEVGEGSFFSVVGVCVDKLQASLAIIGTHGKKGIKQNLLGANILKLVQLLHLPCLVVQDDSEYPEGGFKNVLFPIAAHSRFEMKINQTCELLADDGKVNLYAIHKTDTLEPQLRQNIKISEELFKERKTAYGIITEEATLYSVGFSRQSLDYMGKHDIDMVSIMSQVSNLNSFFGKADKENIILNNKCIPVLCCNDEEVHV